ncbi:signal transduction protein [Sulfuricella denitrificans skB26]|uniref:Signal transduction protein n=2 Tax=Sulfuricella denitrificans TaxID=649841 RepID=S6AA78_SULDS|nr:signal transduction protein [Sulfuricella denitrificans skB26]
MLGRFLKWMFGQQDSHTHASGKQVQRVSYTSLDESKLDGLAPLKEIDHSDLLGQGLASPSPTVSPVKPSVEGGAVPAETVQSFICREPMLDSSGRMAGYEFMLRKSPGHKVRLETRAVLRLYDEVLLRNVMDMDIGRLLGSRLAFIGISPASLGCRLFEDLPKKGVVLVIRSASELIDNPEETLANLIALKEKGFLIALEDFSDVPEMSQFLQVVDLAIIDVSSEDSQRLRHMVDSLCSQYLWIRLIAKNVESTEAYDACRKLRFDYFQGPFLTRLEELEQPRVGANHIRLFELLNLIQKDADITELVNVFKLDPMLTYKFLRYINSVGGGLVMKVVAIEHAIAVLGQKKLYRWLTLLLYSGGTAHPQDRALMENAMVRGRMTETLGREAFSPGELDNLFIVGFFSLLDVLLRVPMGKALAYLNLSEELIQALVHQEGRYAPYLKLAIACEQFEPERIAELAADCGLDVQKVNIAHIDAMLWALEVEQ